MILYSSSQNSYNNSCYYYNNINLSYNIYKRDKLKSFREQITFKRY